MPTVLAVALSLLPMLGCIRPEPPSDPRVRVVRPPAGAAVPDAAVDERDVLHVAYGLGPDAWYATSPDRGHSWNKPVRINPVAGVADAAGLFRGPSLALGRGGRVHAVYYPARAAGAGGLHYARLDSGGTAFTAPMQLARSDGPSDGYAVAAGPSGEVVASWTEPGALMIARSQDDGATFGAPESVPGADPVLTAATRGLFLPDGTYLLLYRDIAGRDRRESLIRWPRGGPPAREFLSVTPWPEDACPTTGGWLAPGGAAAAWETGDTVLWTVPGTGREHATGAVDGRWPIVLSAPNSTVLVSWKENATLKWQLFDASGRPLGAAHSAPSGSADRHAGVVLPGEMLLLLDAAP